jgi:alkylation response protein AidB-like acyl-CoA dehydrogenase
VFELDETQLMLERTVRTWCEKELAPAIPALESGEELPYELLGRLGRELGIAEALAGPAERRVARLRSESRERGDTAEEGGFGADPMLTSVLLKEISRVSPGFGMCLISSLGCAMAIRAQGSAETIERFALPLFRFEKIGAWALTEPGAGSDAFGAMSTSARLEGDELVLDGQKTFISNAPYADVFTVYARVEAGAEKRPVRGIVVERGTPGLETGPPMKKMGMHDSPTGEVFLHECRVPRENLLGHLDARSGARSGAALETLNLERAVMPAMCLGIIERCVEESIAYAKVRVQFGRPIGEHQGVAFKLARMEVALENARNLVFKLAWAQRAGRFDARLASLAKLYCAEQAVRVSLDAIQIHGGAGYMAELPLEKLMRDAKMFEIGGGTNEIQLQTIARSILG